MAVKIRSLIPAMIAHRHASENSRSEDKAMEKLASGLEIVRAADGPSSLIISEQMRSQISGLHQATDNTEVGVSLIRTAESSLGEISKMLIKLRQLAVHASNEAVNDDLMLQADQQEVDNIVEAINRVSAESSFGSKKILNGANGSAGISVGPDLEFLKAGEKTQSSPAEGYEVVITREARKAELITEPISRAMIAGGLKMSMQASGSVIDLEFDRDATFNVVLNEINRNLKLHNLGVTAKAAAGQPSGPGDPATSSRIVFESDEYGSEAVFAVGFNQGNVIAGTGANELRRVKNGRDAAGSIGGETVRGDGRVLKGLIGSKVDGLEIRYSGTRPITEPFPAGFILINQNAMRFQLGGNYGETKKVSVNSTFAKDLARLVENESGFESLQDLDVTEFQKAQDSLRLIEKATNEISTIRGELGAFHKNTLESNLDSLGVNTESIVNSESVIRDSDAAKKFVDLTKSNMMKDTALSMITHSKQSTEKAMRLISGN